MHKALDERYFY